VIRKVVFRACIWVALGLPLYAQTEVTAAMVVSSVCLLLILELSLLVDSEKLENGLLVLAFAEVFLVLYLKGARLWQYGVTVIILAFTAYQTFMERSLQKALEKTKMIRDQGVETSDKLRIANRKLRQEQDRDVHLATLAERSRIAREIHDNVGHMLSRAIMLLGAVRTVNKDKSLDIYLDKLAGTLDEAMRQMRSSVHDLHDESVDLGKNVNDVIVRLSEHYTVNADIDIGMGLDNLRVMALIAILREASSNIIRHSNATAVDITLHEHPGFVTLTVQDNGRVDRSVKSMLAAREAPGIGLSNIRERASELGGNAEFSADDGFKVFVNLPKGTLPVRGYENG